MRYAESGLQLRLENSIIWLYGFGSALWIVESDK